MLSQSVQAGLRTRKGSIATMPTTGPIASPARTSGQPNGMRHEWRHLNRHRGQREAERGLEVIGLPARSGGEARRRAPRTAPNPGSPRFPNHHQAEGQPDGPAERERGRRRRSRSGHRDDGHLALPMRSDPAGRRAGELRRGDREEGGELGEALAAARRAGAIGRGRRRADPRPDGEELPHVAEIAEIGEADAAVGPGEPDRAGFEAAPCMMGPRPTPSTSNPPTAGRPRWRRWRAPVGSAEKEAR